MMPIPEILWSSWQQILEEELEHGDGASCSDWQHLGHGLFRRVWRTAGGRDEAAAPVFKILIS